MTRESWAAVSWPSIYPNSQLADISIIASERFFFRLSEINGSVAIVSPSYTGIDQEA